MQNNLLIKNLSKTETKNVIPLRDNQVSRISAAFDRLDNPLTKSNLSIEIHGFYHLPEEWVKEENDIHSSSQQPL